MATSEVGARQGSVRSALLASAVGAILLLGWRHASAVELLEDQGNRIQELNQTLTMAEAERRELVEVLNRLPPAPPFLSGTDVGDSSKVLMEAPSDGVYYLVRVTCPFCGANDGALQRIAASTLPLFVVGVDADLPSLRAWLDNHRVPGRAFVNVSGSFIDRFPLERVPRTVVVRSGAIRLFKTGVLDSASTQLVIDSASVR